MRRLPRSWVLWRVWGARTTFSSSTTTWVCASCWTDTLPATVIGSQRWPTAGRCARFSQTTGSIAPVGRRGVEQLLEVVANTAERRLPEVARACVAALGSQLRVLKAQILEFDRRIIAWHRSSATSKRLDAIPASGRRWQQRWSPALLIPRPSDRGETSRPGLGSCRSRTRAGARTGLAVSANEAIGICAACSRQAHSP